MRHHRIKQPEEAATCTRQHRAQHHDSRHCEAKASARVSSNKLVREVHEPSPSRDHILGGHHQRSRRTPRRNHELDAWIPDLGIAFEWDAGGDDTHPPERREHKDRLAKGMGITVYHVNPTRRYPMQFIVANVRRVVRAAEKDWPNGSLINRNRCFRE